MAAQSNLIFAVKYSDVAPKIKKLFSSDYDGVDMGDSWANTLSFCQSEKLLRINHLRAVPWCMELHCEREYNEEPEEYGWIGVAITSRYSPTMADDEDSGGCWPFVFDFRMERIMSFAKQEILKVAPAWFKDANPVWIVKEEFY